jgi:hypothetical protein
MRNFLLVYQDSYAFGKGAMGMNQVAIPSKYMTIK